MVLDIRRKHIQNEIPGAIEGRNSSIGCEEAAEALPHFGWGETTVRARRTRKASWWGWRFRYEDFGMKTMRAIRLREGGCADKKDAATIRTEESGE